MPREPCQRRFLGRVQRRAARREDTFNRTPNQVDINPNINRPAQRRFYDMVLTRTSPHAALVESSVRKLAPEANGASERARRVSGIMATGRARRQTVRAGGRGSP